MPRQIVNLNITRPGGFGLNKQNSGDVLPGAWATKALNCVFDDAGRLAARLGTQAVTTTDPGVDISSIHEYIDLNGNKEIIAAAGSKIYRLNGLVLEDITGPAASSNGDWKFTNFNGQVVGFEAGLAPIIMSGVGTGVFATLTGTGVPSGTNEILAAGGRLYTIENSKLRYSDLLDPTTWAGEIDLARNWPAGGDVGIALAEWNGNLIVFGERSIVILSDPQGDFNPDNFVITEAIPNIGCVARDSVVSIGSDMMFLSRAGVRALGRVIQEKSLPVNEVSQNVNDDVIQKTLNTPASKIKGAYSQTQEFYLLSFNTSETTYVFDTKRPNSDGSIRVTEWDYTPGAAFESSGGRLYLGRGSTLALYRGYLDNVAATGIGGDSYTWEYESGWNDFGQNVADRLKIPKRLTVRALGGSGQDLDYKVAYDYVDFFTTQQIQIEEVDVAEWGIFQWGVGEWSGGAQFHETSAPTSRTGRVVKIGLALDINGGQFALNQIGLAAKLGKAVI